MRAPGCSQNDKGPDRSEPSVRHSRHISKSTLNTIVLKIVFSVSSKAPSIETVLSSLCSLNGVQAEEGELDIIRGPVTG